MKKFVILFGQNGCDILSPNGDGMGNMHITRDQLEHRFAFHPANTDERKDAHQQVREVLLEAADEIVEATGPPTREQSLAITKLEEAMFWANAAIAREGMSSE